MVRMASVPRAWFLGRICLKAYEGPEPAVPDEKPHRREKVAKILYVLSGAYFGTRW